MTLSDSDSAANGTEGLQRDDLRAPFIDRLRPMPGIEDPYSNVWGHDRVVPRDTTNGIEDPDWCY